MNENTSSANSASTSTPATTPVPTPQASTAGRPASPFNKAQLEELAKAERYCLAALKSKYATPLAKQEVSQDFLNEFHADIIAARDQSAVAGHASNAAGNDGRDATITENDLVKGVRKVQASAKRKYARTQPEKLEDYLVGTDLTASRSALEQHSQSILKKLEDERPPGIDTEFIQKLGEHRTAYVASEVAQTGLDSQAMAERLKRDYQIESIKDRRITIQYATEAEYPHTEPENAPVRREFDLPLNRPFNALKRKSQ